VKNLLGIAVTLTLGLLPLGLEHIARADDAPRHRVLLELFESQG